MVAYSGTGMHALIMVYVHYGRTLGLTHFHLYQERCSTEQIFLFLEHLFSPSIFFYPHFEYNISLFFPLNKTFLDQ